MKRIIGFWLLSGALALAGLLTVLPAPAQAVQSFRMFVFYDPCDLTHVAQVEFKSPSTTLAAALSSAQLDVSALKGYHDESGHYVAYADASGRRCFQVFDSPQPTYSLMSTQASPRLPDSSTYAQASAACDQAGAYEDDTLYAYLCFDKEPHVLDGAGVCSVCGYRAVKEQAPSGSDEAPQPEARAPGRSPTFSTGTAMVGKLKYRLRKNGTATCLRLAKRSARCVKVPAHIVAKGHTYRVTRIAKRAFAGNAHLKKAVVGANVSRIGAKAFYKCTGLRTVKISSKVLESIGRKAFAGCTRLKSFACKTKNVSPRALERAGIR